MNWHGAQVLLQVFMDALTSSEHYKSMMGKTIDSVTYYTDKGIITFDVNDEKVLTKTGVKATVANIHTTDTEAAVTLDGTLPEGFAAKYTVDGTEVAYADGKITTGTLAAGSILWLSAMKMANMHRSRLLSMQKRQLYRQLTMLKTVNLYRQKALQKSS